jgi:hypothetical protein
MQIGLRQISRVPRLGKQAEIGQFEPCDQFAFLLKNRVLGLFIKRRMDQEQAQHDDFHHHRQQKECGLSHSRAPTIISSDEPSASLLFGADKSSSHGKLHRPEAGLMP